VIICMYLYVMNVCVLTTTFIHIQYIHENTYPLYKQLNSLKLQNLKVTELKAVYAVGPVESVASTGPAADVV